jgi:sterol 3beta-glucosyltransferase
MKSLRQGDLGKNRAMIREILDGCWASCISASTDGEPFVANAIIANPPSFAHVHCAQALAVPLHIMFTMPWSPTRAFPHPLANISNKTTDPKLANYVSYGMIQLLTWNGYVTQISKINRLTVEPASEISYKSGEVRSTLSLYRCRRLHSLWRPCGFHIRTAGPQR